MTVNSICVTQNGKMRNVTGPLNGMCMHLSGLVIKNILLFFNTIAISCKQKEGNAVLSESELYRESVNSFLSDSTTDLQNLQAHISHTNPTLNNHRS